MISQGRMKIGGVLFILLNVVMLNAVIQTELRNGQWQLIGFMGPQGSKASVDYRQDTNREVIDIADENTTYLVKENDTTSGQLQYKTGLLASDLSLMYTGTTTQIGSSIGIFAIKNTQSPSGKTTLASTLATAVKMKIGNPKQFIENIPKYRMYLEGRGRTPAVRIDYQADYEGQTFKIKFGDESKDYVGYFNHENTFATPVVLIDSSTISTGLEAPYFAPIQDSIDFDINDNNLTKMLINNEFTVKNTSGVYNQDLTDYSSSPDYQVTVYRLNNGKWDNFDSRNAQESSNQFNTLDTGRGYWIKIDNAVNTREVASQQLDPVKTGLISSSTTIISDSPYSDANDDWNLLSFKDTDVRYAPGGVFIPQNVWQDRATFGGVVLFFKSEGRAGGVFSGRISLGTTTDNNYSDTNAAARAINLAMQVKNDVSSEFHKIRAIPAMDFNNTYGTAIPGIIVLSDDLFEINTSGNTTINAPSSQTIKTIAKGNLKQLANGNYGSVYGEYMNFININTALDAFPDVNSSLAVYIHNGNSAVQKAGSLNDGNNTNRLKSVLEAFELAATKNGETTPYTRTAGYLTALNFDAESDYNSNDRNMTTMLITAGERYSISDSTFTKVYKYKDGGKFAIVSSLGSRNVDATTATTAVGVVAMINAQSANTGVVAIDLGVATGTTNEYFAITSTEKGLELLENDSMELFEDISLTNGSIPNIDRTKGPITTVYSTNNLFNTSIVINRDVIDGNATYFGVFDTNYTRTFEENRTFENNTSGGVFTASPAPWATQTVYFTNSDFNLTGNIVIGGDLVVENSTLRVGKSLPATLTVNGRIITIGSSVTLDFNKSSRVTTGFFNNRDSNATSSSQLNPTGGTIAFNADVNVSNIDINGTLLSYAQTTINSVDLDKNVSNIMVGLFDLRGSNFPSINDDLKYDSHWVLDFPLQGGIIEDFSSNYNKDIKSILTMDYSSAAGNSGESYWRNTDLTKNIDTLYGNAFNTDNDKDFDNDYQGIFRIQPNKAYWVNLKSKNANTDTIDSIVDTISAVTDQAKVHFSNTFNEDGISTTQNHINHKLNIKFNGFIGNQSNYYNVVAIIVGKRYYLKRNGSIFSLDINDNEMALNVGTTINKEIPIILEVYDGKGTKIKETVAQHKYSITFYKPQVPVVSWDNQGKLLTNALDGNGTILELYASSVSDIDSERAKKKLQETDLSSDKIVELAWNFDSNLSLRGGLTPIRVMAKSVDGFYSDIRTILYAPVDKGHVLIADVNNEQATNPYSYLQKQQLTKRDPNNTGTKNYPDFVDANGTTNGVNGGVQLNLIKEAINGKGIMNNNIKIAYYPDGETEGAKSLAATGFGGSRVMYLRVNTGPTTTNAIASITYLPGYEDKLFYIYFNGKLYQGRFAGNDAYSNDGNAYNLEGVELAPSAFTNNSPAQAMIGGSAGVVIKSDTAPQSLYTPAEFGGADIKSNNNTPSTPNNNVPNANPGSQLPN